MLTNTLDKTGFLRAGFVVVLAILWGAGQSFAAGGTVEESRDVSGFDEIETNGSIDVFVKKGSTFSVRLRADADVIDAIETVVTGDRLTIGLARGRYGRIKVLEAYITLPTLTELELNGSGSLDVDMMDGDSASLSLRGSGDIEIETIDVEDVSIELKGSGDIEAEGRCNMVDIELKGSGDIELDDLRCANAEVSISGSGDVEIYASKAFTGSVRGSGDINVYGNPDQTSSRASGSGDIEIMN